MEGSTSARAGMSAEAIAIREAFLTRCPEGSASRSVDAAILGKFDGAGLGAHPKVLAMLEQLAKPDSELGAARRAKGKAYALLDATLGRGPSC